jgi:hypothetical protein
MEMFESTVTETILVFPFVSFTSIDGKEFCFPRERIVHTETYHEGKDESGHESLVDDKTYVVFTSHNPKSRGNLHAVVDMPLAVFRDQVIRPAYEGRRETIS